MSIAPFEKIVDTMKKNYKTELNSHIIGRSLIGDEFSAEEIQQWFRDEQEGYAMLGAQDHDPHWYQYHALNTRYGFSALPNRRIGHALGLGSAYGQEFLPIVERIDRLTILEPSEKLRACEVGGLKLNYVVPNATGELPFADNTFDLITCFGVLHHIPNVSFVVSEISRVLNPGGLLLMREPIVNMGDWRQPRRGLTARERGIPKPIMENALGAANLITQSAQYVDFPPFNRLLTRIGAKAIFNSQFLTLIDALLATLFSWNARYHRPRLWDKCAPASVFWVCRKPFRIPREA